MYKVCANEGRLSGRSRFLPPQQPQNKNRFAGNFVQSRKRATKHAYRQNRPESLKTLRRRFSTMSMDDRERNLVNA